MENKRFAKGYGISWLTLNRECNMRCKWCYGCSSGYDTKKSMTFEDAKKCIDIVSDMEIKKINLIGGEPTMHPNFFDIIDYAAEKKISCNVVTNGLKLVDETFFNELLKRPNAFPSISIKSDSKESYISDTGVNCWDRIVGLIKKLLKSNKTFGCTYVISNENVNKLYKTMKTFQELGLKNVGLSFCYSCPGNVMIYDVKQYVKDIETQLKMVDQLSIKYNIHFTLPVCLWDKEFIDNLRKRKIISTVCQLQQKSGLIFDTNLDILVCNTLYDYPIVKAEEYNDAKTLTKLLNSDKIMNVYKDLLRLPSKKCTTCEYLENCGGGCVLTWQYLKLDDLI
ncbi:MAG: radical SAM protein [Clostridia bacterium]|nr:radical SAM protein [Clostridia bacterium]